MTVQRIRSEADPTSQPQFSLSHTSRSLATHTRFRGYQHILSLSLPCSGFDLTHTHTHRCQISFLSLFPPLASDRSQQRVLFFRSVSFRCRVSVAPMPGIIFFELCGTKCQILSTHGIRLEVKNSLYFPDSRTNGMRGFSDVGSGVLSNLMQAESFVRSSGKRTSTTRCRFPLRLFPDVNTTRNTDHRFRKTCPMDPPPKPWLLNSDSPDEEMRQTW